MVGLGRQEGARKSQGALPFAHQGKEHSVVSHWEQTHQENKIYLVGPKIYHIRTAEAI